MVQPLGLFKHTINTQRSESTVDSAGAVIETFTNYLTDVKCLVQPADSDENVKAGRQFSNGLYYIYCENDKDICMKDIVEFENELYEVIKKDIYPDTYMKLLSEKVNV